MMRFLIGVVCVLLCSLGLAVADDTQPVSSAGDVAFGDITASTASEPVLNDGTVKSAELQAPNLPDLFGDKWNFVVQALDAGEIRRAHEDLLALNDLRIKHGFEALENYSIQLLHMAEESVAAQDNDGAAFLTRKALLLSPRSPRVLLESLWLLPYEGESSATGNIIKALSNSTSQPALFFDALNRVVYPALWALTFSMYVVFVMYLVVRMQPVLRGVALRFPMMLRGFVTPPLVAAALITPCFFGPVWSLACWAGLMLYADPQRRWLPFIAGVLLVLWGSLIPIRENLNQWLSDNGIQTMLNVSAGYYSPGDRHALEKLVQNRSNDGVAFYVYAQLLRRLGDLDKAHEASARAEMLLGSQPWTKEQRGLIQYLMGHNEQADKLLNEAQQLGASSAAHFFNRSKVRFTLLDTEQSREFFRLATKADPELARVLSDRESLMGEDNKVALAEVSLPLLDVIRSALSPAGIKAAHYDRISKSVMYGMNPSAIMFVGAVLLLWVLVTNVERKRSKFFNCYERFQVSRLVLYFFRCIPGGSFVLAGKPAWGVAVLSVLIFLFLPAVFWPKDGVFMLDVSQSYYYVYVGVLGFLAFTSMIIGLTEEVEN